MKKTLLLIMICLIGCIVMTGCKKVKDLIPVGIIPTEDKIVEVGELTGFSYHPGYGDMDGAYHFQSLEKNEDGDWVIIVSDKDNFSEPLIIRTYEVSDEAFEDFESFIKENNILALSDRKDSDLFVTDYTPWYYSFSFDNTSVGGDSRESYSIEEYKEYSDKDQELLEKLDTRIKNLRGKMISEVEEKDDDYDDVDNDDDDDVSEGEDDGSDTGDDKDGGSGAGDGSEGSEEAYIESYKPVFEEIMEVIENGYDYDATYDYVSDGLVEKVMYPGEGELSETVGYLLEDLSGDGVPELLIGTDENYGEGPTSYIYSIFTLKDDEPYSVMDGWARSSYQSMGDGHFFYMGSGGASITLLGENHLSKDGTEIEWVDFYFTDEDGTGKIGKYHNTSGTFDAAVSEELKMSDDEFYGIMDDYEKRCKNIEWIPMKEAPL
ncbi:MAG: hypothetical protein K6E90_04055 [Lachnospiraceae bacterium]|nr:hypothetical protein [Lachnospiraceae bacterium]